ncbi:MAG: exodeoxyribonuclease III [Methylobacter sp.]
MATLVKLIRIITLNANGIRSAVKGFSYRCNSKTLTLFAYRKPKLRYISLIRINFAPQNYHCFYHDAGKKGYSGVALYCRKQPDKIISGIGWPDIDAEGRFIEARLGNLSVISLYLPSATSGEVRQAIKLKFMDRFMPYLQACAQNGRDYIICSDWNIAHKEIDLKNWRANQKNSGFLPEESLDGSIIWEGIRVYAFRLINKEAWQYTWWSNRGQAWAKNVGWQIDYQVVSSTLKDKVISASICVFPIMHPLLWIMTIRFR